MASTTTSGEAGVHWDPKALFARRNEAIATANAEYRGASTLQEAPVPTIDLSTLLRPGAESAAATRLQCLELLRRACTDTGFFSITNHGVSGSALRAFRTATAAFFALGEDEKAGVSRPGGKLGGYMRLRAFSVNKLLGRPGPPDFKESWSCGPAGSDTRVFPSEASVPGFAAAVDAFYIEMDKLDSALMDIFTEVLRLETGVDVPDGWMARAAGDHKGLLSVNHYPACDSGREGEERLAGHADLSMFTVLLPDGPGLEVLGSHGTWQRVPMPPESAFIVNVGDLLEVWSNGRFKSSVHRVPIPAGGCPERTSIAYFTAQVMAEPKDDEVAVAPVVAEGDTVKYPTFTVREHVQSLMSAWEPLTC